MASADSWYEVVRDTKLTAVWSMVSGSLVTRRSRPIRGGSQRVPLAPGGEWHQCDIVDPEIGEVPKVSGDDLRAAAKP